MSLCRMNEEAALYLLSEMPVWARLEFAKMIPETYFFDGNMLYPRTVQDTVVTGFERRGDTVWIYFEISWPDDFKTHRYLWPVSKP